MKKSGILLLFLAFMLIAGCAGAQQLPSVECFSPGFLKLTEKMQESPAVQAEASLTAENLFYIRNMTVLQAILKDTTIRYQGGGDTDELTLWRGGEELMEAALTANDSQTLLRLDGQVLNLTDATPDEAQAENLDFLESLQTVPVLERIPLVSMAEKLESAQAGEMLFPYVTVASPFSVTRTMSDDGERLTKLDIEGSLRILNQEWTITGFIRHPGGKSPKDTAELVFETENSHLELSYSATRKSEIEQKNRKGTMSVSTAVKLAGKIDGNSVHTTLKVSTKNEWTADGEKLNEKITVTTTLAHKDDTPGRRMQRLNRVDATCKNILRITTTETEQDTLSFTDAVTMKIDMDSNTFLEGGMKLSVTVGGEKPEAVSGEAKNADRNDLKKAFDAAVEKLSARLYAQLGSNIQNLITSGLQ